MITTLTRLYEPTRGDHLIEQRIAVNLDRVDAIAEPGENHFAGTWLIWFGDGHTRATWNIKEPFDAVIAAAGEAT